jgi:hypothetical protein
MSFRISLDFQPCKLGWAIHPSPITIAWSWIIIMDYITTRVKESLFEPRRNEGRKEYAKAFDLFFKLCEPVCPWRLCGEILVVALAPYCLAPLPA